MRLTLDPESPVPAFHQLAEAIRYRIAVGRLEPGDRLPSLRSAADELGVHYHTVRRAYSVLETDGLLEIRRGSGAVVRPGGPSSIGSALSSPLRAFLTATIEQAWERHGIPAGELADLIRAYETVEVLRGTPPSILECNAPQARDYADQISSALGIEVATRLLSEPGEPPPGLLIGTYFHFNEIRERWPHRVKDTSFVTVEPDPDLPGLLLDGFGAGSPIIVCEPSETRAHNVLPDLIGLLPPDLFRVEVRTDPPEELLKGPEFAGPVLLAPRIWAELTAEQRADPRAVQLRYVIRYSDLAGLRDRLARSERFRSKPAQARVGAAADPPLIGR